MFEDKVKRIMSSVFKIAPEQIGPQTDMDSVESWDSLKHMSMIMSLEEEFELKFSDTEIEDMTDYESILRKVDEKSGS